MNNNKGISAFSYLFVLCLCALTEGHVDYGKYTKNLSLFHTTRLLEDIFGLLI